MSSGSVREKERETGSLIESICIRVVAEERPGTQHIDLMELAKASEGVSLSVGV